MLQTNQWKKYYGIPNPWIVTGHWWTEQWMKSKYLYSLEFKTRAWLCYRFLIALNIFCESNWNDCNLTAHSKFESKRYGFGDGDDDDDDSLLRFLLSMALIIIKVNDGWVFIQWNQNDIIHLGFGDACITSVSLLFLLSDGRSHSIKYMKFDRIERNRVNKYICLKTN